MGGLGEFGALFNPGMRHEMEERRAKEMRREEEGNAREGPLHIDLESGVAVIPGDDDGGDGERGETAARGNGGDADRDETAARGNGGDADRDGAAADDQAADHPDPVAEVAPGNDSAADDSAADDSAANGAANGTPQQAAGGADDGTRPGHPQQPARSAGAVPSGKARRRAADPPRTATAPVPTGKARRGR